jgi:hypothetical protein
MPGLENAGIDHVSGRRSLQDYSWREEARPVWGFTEATFRFHIYHLSQLHLNMYNISCHFSCTIWWLGKAPLKNLCF